MKTKIIYRKVWISFTILIVGISLTIAASIFIRNKLETASKQEFALACNDIKTKITERLHTHAQLLRSCSAFYTASDYVSRNDWKVFIESSKSNKNLPGIVNIGFSIIVNKNQLRQHIHQIRNEGFPHYTVYPAGDREIYTSIIYLEPFTKRNRKALGYDMYSEPIRRKAMEQARDYDVAALSGRVFPAQGVCKELRSVTLMYIPVYHKEFPTNTIKERRAAILGWVYSPYRMSDLMLGILGTRDFGQKNKIHLQIYDNDSISQNSILFDSQRKGTSIYNDTVNQSLTIPIVFNNKKWTLLFTQSNVQSLYFQSKVLIILIGGLIISLLLFILSRRISSTHFRAQLIAKQLTLELKESEERFIAFMDNMPVSIFIKDKYGRNIYFNRHLIDLLGFKNWENKLNSDLLTADEALRISDDDKRAMEQEKYKLEETMMDCNGNYRIFETHKFIIARQDQDPFLGGISLDITDRKEAEKELEDSREQLRNYASHLQYVREKERISITSEIHDSLAQFLVALKIDIGMYKKKILKDEVVKKEEVILEMEQLIIKTDNTINSARRIMNGLRPEQLELLGLVEAAEVHIRQFEENHHIKCRFECTVLNPNILPDKELALFRILQESLNNILKHAMATLVTVHLTNNADKLVLEIVDNGVGFNKKNCILPDSYGLIDMKELVRMLNGVFHIESKKGEGTRVRVEIPCSPVYRK
jgi:PAS domain S-box-containing protein